MFGFVQWDDPLALLLEVLLSAVVVIVVVFFVRRANAQGSAVQGPSDEGSPPQPPKPEGE